MFLDQPAAAQQNSRDGQSRLSVSQSGAVWASPRNTKSLAQDEPNLNTSTEVWLGTPAGVGGTYIPGHRLGPQVEFC